MISKVTLLACAVLKNDTDNLVLLIINLMQNHEKRVSKNVSTDDINHPT